MLVRTPYSFLFILAVCCWFRHNAAIPLTFPSSNQMQDTFKEKETDSQTDLDDAPLDSRSITETKTSSITSNEVNESDKNENSDESDEDDDDKIQNTISNLNVNINKNFNRNNRIKNKRHKESTIENIKTLTEYRTLEELAREETSSNCTSSNKKNQRYSSSFIGSTTNRALTVEKEFHDVVGNNSKVKKSGSVHEGEDITLCWIETTTIKEDKAIRPPKRLVIREYTISFENSATIPERYIECKKYEGELGANDPDIGKTALFEVIDEDTMVSRIVNFTSVSHVGNITIWQHKKVKCGVGPVVSKNIVELTDDSKNPKKRVEIKVSPKLHQLTATTTEEEPWTESSEEIEKSSTLESVEHTTELSCENGVCKTTKISPSISTKSDNEISTAEEIVTEMQSKTESESEEDRSLLAVTKSLSTLPEEVSRRSTTFPKILTTKEKTKCEENSSDPACLTHKYGTISSEEFFPELSAEVSTTEAIKTEAATVAETSPISGKEISTEEEISLSSVEDRLKKTTQSLFTKEGKKITNLITKGTTPFAIITDISMESSEARAPQSTDQISVDDSSTSSEMTSHSSTEHVEESKPEEGSSDSFIELASKEIEHIPSSSMTSGEVNTEPVTTAVPIEFTEFTKAPGKPGQSLDKLSETPTSSEGVTRAVITESSSTSGEVPSEESKESVTSSIEETTMAGLKTSSEEGKFTSTSTKLSPTEIRSTTLPPASSSELEHSCENSEECEYITSSEACDEFGNCGDTTTRCDSETCSEEEITEDQSKFGTSPSSTATKVSLPTTSSQLSEKSAMTENQPTTVANVATTMLTSRENENNSTTVNNVPITMDTRRSTTSSTPQHKLTLKVKVLLEHINENKEKHNLVEVEKNLSLDENPENHYNPDLLEQLKSLNESVNMETLNALLNCTSLGNLTRNSNFVNKKLDDAVDGSDEELESTNVDLEDSISEEQFSSGYTDAKDDYSEYEEISSRGRKRRRRSLEMQEINRFVKRNLYDPTDSAIDSVNSSKSQQIDLVTDSSQFSTTTNYSEEQTTVNERNVTNDGDESTVVSTTMNIIDLLNASESYNANLTQENMTTNKPDEETNNTVSIENGKNITNGRNESAMSLMKENISNETKMEVARKALPGIQEDVVVGLQHMVSQLANTNLTAINNIKETVKTNLLNILADPKDTRVHTRRRRAATEEVGHWSNERIKQAPMGGNLRSLTEFTLYKVLS